MIGLSGVVGRAGWVVVGLAMACRPGEPTPSAEPPSTGAIDGPSDGDDAAAEPPQDHAGDPAGGDASPQDESQVTAPAPTDVLTVGQAHVLAPELAGQTVIVEGTLRWAETRCTKSVPPSCSGRWLMREGEMVRGPALPIEADGVTVPMVCVAASTTLTPTTPCPSGQVLDIHARVLVHGKLRMGAEGPELVAERFEPHGSDAN